MNGIGFVERWGRRGLAIVLAGLAIQGVAHIAWSPGTFILSVAVGLPLVIAGGALFGWAVLRAPRADRDAGASGGPT